MNFQTRGGLIILISLIGFIYQTSSSHRLLSKYLLFCLITLSFLLLFNLHYLTFFVNNRCVCQKKFIIKHILNICMRVRAPRNTIFITVVECIMVYIHSYNFEKSHCLDYLDSLTWKKQYPMQKMVDIVERLG